MNKTTDGWHKVYSYYVMIEDGIVKYAVKRAINKNGARNEDYDRTLYPYRLALYGGWDRIYEEEKLSLNALRSGLRRGTIALI